MNSLKSISNQELVNQLRKLVSKEQDLTLQILPHLVEVERRELYLERHFNSLYEYCKQEFNYSDASAWRRAGAAVAILKCPEAWDLLLQKRVTITALAMISRLITPELLLQIRDRSKSQVELIVSAYRPKTAIPDKARPVMVPRKIDPPRAPRSGSATNTPGAATLSQGEVVPLRGEVDLTNVKLSFEQKWKVEGVVSQCVHEKLERCKKLLSRKYPDGVDYDTLFDDMTELYLDKNDPERREIKPRATKNRQAGHSRYIPGHVKTKVWKRDGGRCTFAGSDGRRCDCDHNLQYDHYPVPFARGGKSTADNLRLLCAKHNKHTAKKTYGEATITRHYVKESPAAYIAGTGPPDGGWARSDFIH